MTHPPEWSYGNQQGQMIHVYPLDDLVEHNTNDPESCICGPTLEPVDGGTLIRHHSLDGREFSEDDYDGPPMPRENP